MLELAAAARRAGRLGLDTEFVGEGRYRTLLCLVQVVVENGQETRVEVIDALSPGLDPAPLAAVLADPEIEVVVHAGRQDVALLRGRWETEVRNLLDTQVAAGFAGMRAQAGYDSLLQDVLGVRLRKTASYTRWDSRPLSREQIEYAREDVLHLLDLAAELRSRLEERGRLEWALEECRSLEQASDERDVDAIFARLPRINGLDPAVRAVAFELVQWREQLAAVEDRPVSSVLNDSALIEVARRRPAALRQLEQIRGVTPATLHRRGRDLLGAVERGRVRPPIPADGGRRPPPLEQDAPLVALAEALVRARALDAGLAYELLATRAELQAMVSRSRDHDGDAEPRVLTGWRRALVGDELLELLAGRRSLSVTDGGHVRITG
jgi:ribonuclease D